MHPLKQKILDYCLSLPFTEETFPFDTKTWAGKVHGKMFILTDITDENVFINLKCNPDRAEELRGEHDFIRPGYHMSKKHWNTVECITGEVSWGFVKELIDHSYQLVFSSLPKKIREANLK